METKTAGDLLTAIARGQGRGEKEKLTFFFCLLFFISRSLFLYFSRSADSKNNGKVSVDRIQLYTLSFCGNLQLEGF